MSLDYTPISSIVDGPKPQGCAICGEPTICCHYDVPSCNGCKTFFRRSIISRKKYTCNRFRKCDIINGSKCRACRLDKCILAGMNPKVIRFPYGINAEDVIKSIQDRKKVLIEESETEMPMKPIHRQIKESINAKLLNKLKEEAESSGDEPTASGSMEIAIKQELPKTLLVEELDHTKLIDNLLYTEYKLERLRVSEYNPFRLFYSIDDIIKKPCELSNAEYYEKPFEWPYSFDYYQANINKCLQAENEETLLKYDDSVQRLWAFNDFIYVVEAAKTLPFFDHMNSEDKVNLLKHVGLPITVLLESFYSVNKRQTTLILPDGMIPLKYYMSRLQKPEPNKLNEEAYSRSLEPLMRTKPNKVEYVLLKAIMYCYSFIPALSVEAREMLSHYRERYALILLRHLQTRYGETQGISRYLEIITMIEANFYFAQRRRENAICYTMEDTKKPKRPKLFYEVYYYGS